MNREEAWTQFFTAALCGITTSAVIEEVPPFTIATQASEVAWAAVCRMERELANPPPEVSGVDRQLMDNALTKIGNATESSVTTLELEAMQGILDALDQQAGD